MTTSTKAARNSRFQKGSGMYACRCCKRNTRATGNGDNDGVLLCVECYDLAGEENHLSDSGEFHSHPARILEMIHAVTLQGGDASCWDELKDQVEATMTTPAPAAAAAPADELAATVATAREEIARARGEVVEVAAPLKAEPTATGKRQALVARVGDLEAELLALEARVAALKAEKAAAVEELLRSF